jgi:hypothetical protein
MVFELSLTRAWKFDVPAAEGIPAMMPPGVISSPGGNAPEVIDHTYPPVPPSAVNPCEYGTPAVPTGINVVVILKGLGFT